MKSKDLPEDAVLTSQRKLHFAGCSCVLQQCEEWYGRFRGDVSSLGFSLEVRRTIASLSSGNLRGRRCTVPSRFGSTAIRSEAPCELAAVIRPLILLDSRRARSAGTRRERNASSQISPRRYAAEVLRENRLGQCRTCRGSQRRRIQINVLHRARSGVGDPHRRLVRPVSTLAQSSGSYKLRRSSNVLRKQNYGRQRPPRHR
jgi:hypothetical protein